MKIIERIKAWYFSRVQKHVSAVLLALASVDLGSTLTGYASDITALIGAKCYAVLRVLGLATIFWRAKQASPPKP